MSRFVLFAVGFSCLLTSTILAQQLPPGYQALIQVTNDVDFDRRPAMNNRGQFVFAKWVDPNNSQTSEIFLYDIPSGELTRLTYDDVRDEFPHINDDGEIVWSRRVGAGATYEIVLYRDGELTRLTFDDLSDYSPVINNEGLIAWSKLTYEGCADADADIYLYDGETIQRITFGGYSNQGARLNDSGNLVWTQYNFCSQPWWTSEIMMYSDGVVTTLTDGQYEPQTGDINNNQLVGWYSHWTGGGHYIETWQSGVTTLLTDWGSGLRLNNRGDIVFNRYHFDLSAWEVWLYYRGEFWQITDDPFWNRDGDINDHGDIAWMSGPTFDTDIMLLRRFPAGDMNCDGLVNAFDIDPFVSALIDPSEYELAYPQCDYLLADFNADGAINAFDIDPFVQVLTR